VILKLTKGFSPKFGSNLILFQVHIWKMATWFCNFVNSIDKLNTTFKISQLPQALQFKSNFFIEESPAKNLQTIFSVKQDILMLSQVEVKHGTCRLYLICLCKGKINAGYATFACVCQHSKWNRSKCTETLKHLEEREI
jgi:hypothetical protein